MGNDCLERDICSMSSGTLKDEIIHDFKVRAVNRDAYELTVSSTPGFLVHFRESKTNCAVAGNVDLNIIIFVLWKAAQKSMIDLLALLRSLTLGEYLVNCSFPSNTDRV